jgi:predicted amidohydrolase
VNPYDVALIQTIPHVVTSLADRDEVMTRNLDRIEQLVGFACNRVGDVKLAVMGEYSLMGQFRPRSVEDWIKIALPIPNPYTERLGRIAAKYGCYLTGHFLERIEHWPDRYFNVGILVAPSGEIVLKYHKHNGPNNLNTSYTGPADIYTEYVERYGVDALFPVVDTPIGRIGMFICGDVQYPEMSRCLAMKGADILVYPTADIYRRAHEGWDAMRRARAAENHVYLASCSVGGFQGSDRPVDGWRGGSLVYGPDGAILVIAGTGEVVVSASVDIDRLRQRKTAFRASGHAYNPMVLMRAELFAGEYARAKRWPNDAFLENPLTSTADAGAVARGILERLIDERNLLCPDEV